MNDKALELIEKWINEPVTAEGEIEAYELMRNLERNRQTEAEGQIEWLTDLKETILDKRLDDAVDNINAAIKMLTTEHGRSNGNLGQ